MRGMDPRMQTNPLQDIVGGGGSGWSIQGQEPQAEAGEGDSSVSGLLECLQDSDYLVATTSEN